jgi:inositol phosphorylceramide mannosyltransferase catalytic subunit
MSDYFHRMRFTRNANTDALICRLYEHVLPTNGYGLTVTCSCAAQAPNPESRGSAWVVDVGTKPSITVEEGTFPAGCAAGEDVVRMLRQNAFPTNFAFLCAPGHMNGFHVVRLVLEQYRPRAIVTSFNADLGTADCVIPYLRRTCWDGTGYFGASRKAIHLLARRYGYLEYYDGLTGTVFLVRKESPVLPFGESLPTYDITELAYKPEMATRPYLSSAHYLLSGVNTGSFRYGYVSYFANDEFIGRQLMRGEYWQEVLLKSIAAVLSDVAPGLALDIGAHVGTHALAMAHLVPQLTFVCFEPQLPLFLLLERNIHENGLSARITARNTAVGHRRMAIKLSDTASDGTSAGARLRYGSAVATNFGGVQLGTGGQPCTLTSIDEESFSDVRYVKLDVEGAEPLVLQGMKRTLDSDLPTVVYEDRSDRQLPDATWRMLGTVREELCRPSELLRARGYCTEWKGTDSIAVPALPRRARSLDQLGVQRNNTAPPIPKHIFQTWKTRDALPAMFEAWSSTFKKHNPSYVHRLWSDADNYRFIVDEFSWFVETYTHYPAEIYRADAVRYFYLYLFGGFYADLDTECLRPLDELLTIGDVILGRMGSNPSFPHSLPNAIMASRPRQQFWLVVLDLLLQRSTSSGRPEYVTGPILLKSALDMYIDRDSTAALEAIMRVRSLLTRKQQPEILPSSIVVLDSRRWYPLNWANPIHQRLRHSVLDGNPLDDAKKKTLCSDAWMVTYWSHSWE